MKTQTMVILKPFKPAKSSQSDPSPENFQKSAGEGRWSGAGVEKIPLSLQELPMLTEEFIPT